MCAPAHVRAYVCVCVCVCGMKMLPVSSVVKLEPSKKQL